MIKGASPHLGLDYPEEENLRTLAHWGVENVHDLFIVTLLGQLKQRLYQTQRTPGKEGMCAEGYQLLVLREWEIRHVYMLCFSILALYTCTYTLEILGCTPCPLKIPMYVCVCMRVCMCTRVYVHVCW